MTWYIKEPKKKLLYEERLERLRKLLKVPAPDIILVEESYMVVQAAAGSHWAVIRKALSAIRTDLGFIFVRVPLWRVRCTVWCLVHHATAHDYWEMKNDLRNREFEKENIC
jgi:hypothetical protein